MFNKLFIFSLSILITSIIIYSPFAIIENTITIGPIYINSTMENVYSCLVNQYHNHTLWKLFDYENSTVEFNVHNFNETAVVFDISFEYEFIKFINYKLRTKCQAVTQFDKNNFTISSIARTQDSLVISEPTIKLEKAGEGVNFYEKLKITVPKIFLHYTTTTAKIKHITVANNLKKEIERNPYLCNLK
jgi:hypothetical protein